ncbi:MAG: hypothetical protein GX938_09585 [Spirochaetales bacterium]|nr:hypothetical protein [Spirochaetales bacterium]
MDINCDWLNNITPGDWLQFIGSIIGIFGAVIIATRSNKEQYELNRELEKEFLYKKMVLGELANARNALKQVHRDIIEIVQCASNKDEVILNKLIERKNIEINTSLNEAIGIKYFLNGYNKEDKKVLDKLEIENKTDEFIREVKKMTSFEKEIKAVPFRDMEVFVHVINNKFNYVKSYNKLIAAISRAIEHFVESLGESKHKEFI